MPDASHRNDIGRQWPLAALAALAVVAAGGIAIVVSLEHGDFRIAAMVISLLALFVVLAVIDRRRDRMLRAQEVTLDAAVNNMSQGLCMFDGAARLVVCNPRYLNMYNLSAAIVKPGCTLREMIVHRKDVGMFSGDPDEYVARMLARRSEGKTTRATVELADGRIIDVVNQPMANGGWVATHEDVTELRRGEKELARTRAFLDTVIDNVPAAIVVKDARDLRFVLVNRAGEDIYGMSRDRMIGKTIDQIFPGRSNEYITGRDHQAIEARAPLDFGEHTFDSPHRGSRVHSSRRMAIFDEKGQAQFVVSVIQDLTEKKLAEAQIDYLAHHDPLTELPNRAAFHEHLAEERARAAAVGEKLAVLCLDLDRYKEINDVFGHSVGDTLMRAAARRLQAAAEDAFFARQGSDEFALVVVGNRLPERAAELADRLLAAVGDVFEIEGQHLHVGISVGISMFPSDGTDETTLLANADAALYRAKAEGRGSVRFFEADMDQQLRERRALAHDLRSAIAHNELILHYQPLAQIDGTIVGFEALTRWRHPTRGLIPPNVFIPLAEETGIILELGDWVLREACREAASWPKALRIAVNVSPVQFRHGDLFGLVHSVLMESGLRPNRLELEITENVLMDDLPRAVAILRRLKTLGVQIAMDDFGTGYSSLQNLQSFAFDKLKIDRSFISDLETNPQSATIVRAVIGLGRGLALPVVAEGVETRTQLDFLSSESCDEVQGYLVGRPQPIEAYADKVGRAEKREAALSAAG